MTQTKNIKLPPVIKGKKTLGQRITRPSKEKWNTQADLAALSSNSTHIIATKAGHNIQVDEPQLVIDAILKVIAQVKK